MGGEVSTQPHEQSNRERWGLSEGDGRWSVAAVATPQRRQGAVQFTEHLGPLSLAIERERTKREKRGCGQASVMAEVGEEVSPVGLNPATTKSHTNQGFEG